MAKEQQTYNEKSLAQAEIELQIIEAGIVSLCKSNITKEFMGKAAEMLERAENNVSYYAEQVQLEHEANHELDGHQ
jgi:hypothetical protein